MGRFGRPGTELERYQCGYSNLRAGSASQAQCANMKRASLNWGLASAMGVILLAAILVLYWVYDKIVGIDNMRLG